MTLGQGWRAWGLGVSELPNIAPETTRAIQKRTISCREEEQNRCWPFQTPHSSLDEVHPMRKMPKSNPCARLTSKSKETAGFDHKAQRPVKLPPAPVENSTLAMASSATWAFWQLAPMLLP